MSNGHGCPTCATEGREVIRDRISPELAIDETLWVTGYTIDPDDPKRRIAQWECDQGHRWTSVQELLTR
jgi:hypothetical protein